MLKKFIELNLSIAQVRVGIQPIPDDFKENIDYDFEAAGIYNVNVNKIISFRQFKNYIEFHTSSYIIGKLSYVYEVFKTEEEAKQRYHYLYETLIGG